MEPAESSEIDSQTRLWGMLLHLSVFFGYMLPIAGLIAPILIWQIKKTDLPLLDQHGKNLMNWIISALIYGGVSGLLCFLVIGIPLLILLLIATIVFPIIAAIKANNGELWKYPLAIEFVK